MPADNIPMTAVLMLVMLGLTSAGIPSVMPSWSNVIAFVVPMITGLITALLWQADGTHFFLAGCCAIYLGATLHFAHRQHLLLTETLLMRFENEALAHKLAEQVEATQRASEEKTRFFAAASHDLRQPLHAIALFGAVIEKKMHNGPEHAHAARLMSAVHALGTSLDTMLDVSRLDAGVIVPSRQDIPLNLVFQSINQTFAARAEAKGLLLRMRATPLWVHTDLQLLQRLLANLVDNAVKYTSQGGVLVVARKRQGAVWIDVCDSGQGIAPEQRTHIFEEFYQVDNPGRDRSRGLGIGLSIVRRLSNLLGYSVQVQSQPERGSRFRVVMDAPVSPQPAFYADLVPNKAPATAAQLLPQRVLVIDDETDIGDAVAALLDSCGVACHVTTDEAGGHAAFEAAREEQRPFDALLCDFRLAHGADGLDVAQRLMATHAPGLPLLLVTGETAPDRLLRVRSLGVPVLFKPVMATALLEALAKLRPQP
jgi:signal transduction histidine kinase